eukprot:gene14867-31560_t
MIQLFADLKIYLPFLYLLFILHRVRGTFPQQHENSGNECHSQRLVPTVPAPFQFIESDIIVDGACTLHWPLDNVDLSVIHESALKLRGFSLNTILSCKSFDDSTSYNGAIYFNDREFLFGPFTTSKLTPYFNTAIIPSVIINATNLLKIIIYETTTKIQLSQFHIQFKIITNNSLDFIYIDAAHDYFNVMSDMRAWWPKLINGGVFAGHNLQYIPVRSAVTEF